jgi:hypothetical protein
VTVDQTHKIFPRVFESTDSIRVEFERNGFVSIKKLLSPDFVNEIASSLRTLFSSYSHQPELETDSAIIQLNKNDKKMLHQLHSAAQRISELRRIPDVLAPTVQAISGLKSPVFELSGGFLLGMPEDSRLVYEFHQESNFMKGFSAIYNFHFPILRDSTTENGTMSALRGSHKLGTLPFKKEKVSHDSYTNLVPLKIERIKSDHEEVHFILEVGDCVVFHQDLIHRSNFNSSTLCRLVGTSRLTQDVPIAWSPSTSSDL